MTFVLAVAAGALIGLSLGALGDGVLHAGGVGAEPAFVHVDSSVVRFDSTYPQSNL